MPTPPDAAAKAPPGQDRSGLWRYAFLVGIGAFATTFAQQRVVANIPTTALLKDGFHLEREEVAVFFFWATFAWNLKPVAGVFTDAFPLFGTRRRNYMMLGATLAGVCWLAMGALSTQYEALLLASMAMNAFTVLSSTVMGGMMVEAGQAYGAPGRISSLRQVVQSVAQVIGPMAGGALAGMAFGWTTGIAACTVFALAATTFFVHHEERISTRAPLTEEERARPRYRPPPKVLGALAGLAGLATYLVIREDLRNIGISLFALMFVLVVILGLAMAPTENPVIVRAQGQLTQIFDSRTLWFAVFMLFLVYTVPGLFTSLYYQQTDELKFSDEYIGFLGSLEGGVGIAAAVLYGVICRRLRLRELILGGVGLSALATFTYLTYDQQTAPFVHGGTGFFGVMAELALMDLAVRSTPKGCEALGFSLMMAVRNFGIAMSDVIGTLIMDHYHVSFNTMVVVNGATSLAVLVFVFFLPASVIHQREGEQGAA